MANGKLVISLDFEIYWGVRDAVTLKQYGEHLLGVQKVIPLLLDLFKQYDIQATFATVGFLFFNTKEELLKNLPNKKPEYKNAKLSPYTNHFDSVGENEKVDPFHFASSLIQQIVNNDQEIGSHTFSHYYCLEKGQTKEEFKEDLIAAKKMAQKNGIELKSFVFPRNQYNKDYLNVCRELGFTCYRGNEKSWLFSSESFGADNFLRRPFRLLDSYLNLSGKNCYSSEEMKDQVILNIPSSRFLRPYSKKLKAFENLRLKRITDSMGYAAKKGLVYHLWWHPHNFGNNIQENFSFLEKILIHYKKLNSEFNFESLSMRQLAKELNNE
ncbi:MAG: polysaccharide deacetylase family protein [Bacteroidota bacterium]|nr:polysaccharide deacetylase family protein [Bacteroidota bacterium]